MTTTKTIPKSAKDEYAKELTNSVESIEFRLF